MVSDVWLYVIKLLYLKTPPSTFSKHVFFYFDQKSVPGLKNVLILMLMYCFGHIVEVLNVLNLCGIQFIPVHPLFLLQESCKQCYFSLILPIFTGRLVKRKKTTTVYTLQIHFKTWCLFLSMIDMYRSLALLCI